MRRIQAIVAAAFLCLPAAATGERADLSWVESWCVWLQDPGIQTLVDSTYDLAVIDYSRDGSAATEFSYGDIERVRDSGKLVLAYFSIGEAEDYRFYWRSNWRAGRGFIGNENPDWEGNYAVKYWSRSWWDQALRPYLDRILAQGFDGVYLDRVDAYWWWYENKGYNPHTMANRMVALVEKIADYTRARAGEHFIVCPQNAVSILDDASWSNRNRYLATVDAVGVESLYYNVWSADDQAYRLSKLADFDAAGRKILVLEYIGPEDWTDFFDAIAGSGLDMVGYPAEPDMMLDELVDLS